MRRRLDLASSLLTRPRVLFWTSRRPAWLRSRNEIWSVVRELARGVPSDVLVAGSRRRPGTRGIVAAT